MAATEQGTKEQMYFLDRCGKENAVLFWQALRRPQQHVKRHLVQRSSGGIVVNIWVAIPATTLTT